MNEFCASMKKVYPYIKWSLLIDRFKYHTTLEFLDKSSIKMKTIRTLDNSIKIESDILLAEGIWCDDQYRYEEYSSDLYLQFKTNNKKKYKQFRFKLYDLVAKILIYDKYYHETWFDFEQACTRCNHKYDNIVDIFKNILEGNHHIDSKQEIIDKTIKRVKNMTSHLSIYFILPLRWNGNEEDILVVCYDSKKLIHIVICSGRGS